MRIIIFFIISLLGCNIVCAQVDIDAIKKNRTEYYSAESYGTTVDEAHRNALAEIARAIKSSVYDNRSDRDHQIMNSNSGEISVFNEQKGGVETFTSVSLSNVEMMVLNPEPEAKVFCWVAKSEVERMLKLRDEKIVDFVKTGKVAESNLRIDDAIRYYYWALMLSKGNGDRVVKVLHEGDSIDVRTFMPLKINSVMSKIKANVESCEQSDGRYYVSTRFKYDGNDVASLQLKYFDGFSYVGPLTVRDGIGELELTSYPNNGKIDIFYEYMFRKDGENLDDELRTVFNGLKPVIINEAKRSVSMSDKKEDAMAQAVLPTDPGTDAVAKIKPEKITIKKRIEMRVIEDDSEYLDIMKDVEEAIRTKNTKMVWEHFTVDGYKMFDTLINRTGVVALTGLKQNYTFIETQERVLARFCKVSIKFKNGKKFMENLVFRFNKDKKIESLAFALTKKAEDDIFNADASLWKEVSRYAILQFMEDYQTAYALKRLDYIDRIFSEDAIIIVGSVLKPGKEERNYEGMIIDLQDGLGNENVEYRQRSKEQYLGKLKTQFKNREYIHLTLEDNEIQLVNAPYREIGTVFAIQIKQLYNSSTYSDQGYLTLVFDASRELPLIGVRLWQQDHVEMVKINDFVKKFKF